jgi:hypothetical protein
MQVRSKTKCKFFNFTHNYFYSQTKIWKQNQGCLTLTKQYFYPPHHCVANEKLAFEASIHRKLSAWSPHVSKNIFHYFYLLNVSFKCLKSYQISFIKFLWLKYLNMWGHTQHNQLDCFTIFKLVLLLFLLFHYERLSFTLYLW